MITGITNLLSQVARIFANKTDGDNAIKINQVKNYRDTDRAMEAAEKFIFSTASYLSGTINERQFKVLYKKYRERFFKYN